MLANLENWAVATGLEKSVFNPISKKSNAKECSNYHTIAFISHASKVMLKILQVRLQQYMNWELWDVQAGFRKGKGTRDQIENIHWIIEKAREFQKNIYFCFIDYAKPLTVWFTKIFRKFFKICLLRNLYVGQEATIRTDMEKQTGSKLCKKYDKTVYCHSAYLTHAEYIMWNARLDETPAEIKTASRNVSKPQTCR